MAEVLLALLIIAILAWTYLRPFGSSPKISTKDGEESPRPSELSSEEQHISDAKRMRDDAFERQLARSEKRSQEKKATESTLKRAREIVEETGLSEAMPSIWKHVSSWRPVDGKLHSDAAPEGFSEVEREETDQREKSVGWRWKGRTYRLDYTEGQNWDEFSDQLNGFGWPAKLGLSVDGEQVISIDCMAKHTIDYSAYKYSDVDSLKVGPWMANVVRIAEELDATSEAHFDSVMDEMDRERAARIDLGDRR